MGWVGLEPTANALKGRCSTIELPTRKEGTKVMPSAGCATSNYGGSALLDHGVGIMVMDRLVVLRFDPIPRDSRVAVCP